MAYESIDRLKKYMQKKIDAIVTGEKVTFNINAHQLLDEINEMERKAKAFDELKKHVDEQGDSYMDLYRQTKDPIFSLLNSNYDGLLGFIEELERE